MEGTRRCGRQRHPQNIERLLRPAASVDVIRERGVYVRIRGGIVCHRQGLVGSAHLERGLVERVIVERRVGFAKIA